MTEPAGTLEALASELGKALKPLEARLSQGNVKQLFAELGLLIPNATVLPPALLSALADAIANASALPPLIGRLEQAIEAENTGQIVTTALELIEKVKRLISSLEALGTALGTVSGTLGSDPAAVLALAGELAKRLLEFSLLGYLEGYWPLTTALLRLAGLVDYSNEPGDPADPSKPPFLRRALRLDRLSGLLRSPVDHFVDVYGWGSPAFDGRRALEVVHLVLFAFAVPAVFEPVAPGSPLKQLRVFPFRLVPSVSPPSITLRFDVDLGSDLHFDLPFVDEWTLGLDLEGALGPSVALVFKPPGNVELEPAGAGGGFTFRVGHRPATPIVLFALDAKSRIQIDAFEASAGVHFGGSAGQAPELELGAALKNGKATFDTSESDGFLQTLLSGLRVESTFDVGLSYSSVDGLRFEGGGSLDIQLASHISLGPIELTALTLTVGVKNGEFPVGITTNIKAALGPLSASVEEIGFELRFRVAADQRGNLGPLSVTPAFRPPKGAGLAIDAGVVRGGGYLYFDPENGEYAGVAELAIAEVVTVKAIGLITTKLPDGSSGFSLLLILSAEFGTGVQLGFGFTLLAVGGLVGLNRTMKLDALMQGVRTGAIESIMFPRDIIANAPKIISDLRAIFPPQQGTFLIGPMAKLGWGTPTLVSVSLGIIIEIPGNIAIVGVLKLAIPADDAALIVLQVNFAGAIEFDKQRLYFFAALFESRIVFLTIEGEMGLLVAFGDDANFVLSVGGFHPSFSPPPLPFPSPKRIVVSLLNTPVSRLSIEGYFAVTSNTVQFGARVDLFFGLDAINVRGHLAFDALFQFSPFYFIIEISASLSVNVFGAGLFSVSVRGELDGPAPWHVKGHGSISLLFWDIGVDFETTWGETRNTELPPISVMPLFEAEIAKPDAWRALLPTSNRLLVSLRKLDAEESGFVLHPLGVLRVSQRALPLEITLDKVGAQKPSDVKRLSLVATGGALEKKNDAFEKFAPAQFQDFSDAEKLSRPAFVDERAGLDLTASGGDLRSSRAVKRIVRYEEIILDSNFKRFQRRFKGLVATLFTFFLGGNAMSRHELSKASKQKFVPFDDRVQVKAETYSVAFQSTNQAFSADSVEFHSEASAREYLREKVRDDTTLEGELQVIPSSERAA